MAKRTPNTTPSVPVLSLAEVAGLTTSATAAAFGERGRIRQRAFVEQGKLIYHLDSQKLKPGQTVYGLLKAQDVSEGSINNARLAAKMIVNLVVPGHLPESRFDEIVTFRIVRQSNALLTGTAAIQLTPEDLSAILATGEKSAIGEELDCLAEHGQTIAEREAALEAEAVEQKRMEKAAAEAEKIRAKQAKQAEAAEKLAAKEAAKQAKETAPATGTTEDPAPEETPESESPEEEEPQADSETETTVIDNRAPASPAPAAIPLPPAKPTVQAVVEEVTAATLKAYEFTKPDEIEEVAEALEQAIKDLRECAAALRRKVAA